MKSILREQQAKDEEFPKQLAESQYFSEDYSALPYSKINSRPTGDPSGLESRLSNETPRMNNDTAPDTRRKLVGSN